MIERYALRGGEQCVKKHAVRRSPQCALAREHQVRSLHWELNPGPHSYQECALPLSYGGKDADDYNRVWPIRN